MKLDRHSMTAGIATAALTGALLVGTALAQGEIAQAPRGPFPAPVGHRQPRLQDLPPSVANAERNNQTPAQKSFDKDLNICRAC